MIRQKPQRNIGTFALAPGQAPEIKQRMLNWANRFSILLFLDSNNYATQYGAYECLLATGIRYSVADAVEGTEDLLSRLFQLHETEMDWLFGHIAYDYKNVLEPGLHSANAMNPAFPLLHFFVPETVCYIDKAKTSLTVETYGDPAHVYEQILATKVNSTQIPKLTFTEVFQKEEYTATISKLREHIRNGDCYEINFCNKGFCEDASVDPVSVFGALNELSPAPYAAFYRLHDKYMMCSSPERYLRKTGSKIVSQPIKGTARRDADATKDQEVKEVLRNDVKERAENVMIVDLVRNDLARCCETGSVAVEELFGIYSFPQVHQMISTVSGQLKAKVPFTDSLRYSFPMGSMTGAPKYKVMELIDQYERSGRGLFSGTVGYITPQGDFDFNVIIRSLFYDSATKYLSYQTGGAITFDSVPEKEWDEMQLKAWALQRIFS